MRCSYYDAGRCRSCTWIERGYGEQLAAKERGCRALLAPVTGPGLAWLPPVASAESAFRNKAKMVVAGSVDDPTLGILDAGGAGVDLRTCGLYPADLHEAFAALARFVTTARLQPYDVPTRTGELKYVLVTRSPDGELMVRFVLRSQEAVARIRKHLPALHAELPLLSVVSVNLLPEHKAVVEGDREILLTENPTLLMRVNGIEMHLQPQSFFQTNTEVAAALYRQARAWVDERAPASLWDLYCGVGGFALHCAAPGRSVVGIETSAGAVASALLSARDLRVDAAFEVGDATTFALGAATAPDAVIVNPPRRGIGPVLAGWLEESGVETVVYSSCNAASLARDLAAMPSLQATRAQVLDMFPQTPHYEVLTLLERVPA